MMTLTEEQIAKFNRLRILKMIEEERTALAERREICFEQDQDDKRERRTHRILPCCVLVNTKRTLISPQPVVAWQTKRRRGLRPSARVGVVRAHRGSTPA